MSKFYIERDFIEAEGRQVLEVEAENEEEARDKLRKGDVTLKSEGIFVRRFIDIDNKSHRLTRAIE